MFRNISRSNFPLGGDQVDKLRAGVELVNYDVSHDSSSKEQSLAYIISAKFHWDSLVSVTEDRYKTIGLPHLNWDPLSFKFSSKEYVPEVEWILPL